MSPSGGAQGLIGDRCRCRRLRRGRGTIYGARSDVTRSTSPREVLPLLYGLARVPVPTPSPGTTTAATRWWSTLGPALLWFFGRVAAS